MNQEAAYDMIGKEISQRYQDWHVALANLPQWGEDIDKRVQLYVRGLRELVVANLWWRYVTTELHEALELYSQHIVLKHPGILAKRKRLRESRDSFRLLLKSEPSDGRLTPSFIMALNLNASWCRRYENSLSWYTTKT